MCEEFRIALSPKHTQLPHKLPIPFRRLTRVAADNKRAAHEVTCGVSVDADPAKKITNDRAVQVAPFGDTEAEWLAPVYGRYVKVDPAYQVRVADQVLVSTRPCDAFGNFGECRPVLICIWPRKLRKPLRHWIHGISCH
jgi:hypothetical protein